jgi:RNA polymerase sigma-B factor
MELSEVSMSTTLHAVSTTHPPAVAAVAAVPADPAELLGDLAVRSFQGLSRGERSELSGQILRAACATSTPETERQALLEHVVRLNMPVAQAVTRRYRQRGVADEDLEQVAYLALIKAARGFDALRHTEFLSYAVPTIRGELRKHFRDHGWAVRPPRRIQELQAHIGVARDELFQSLGRSPRPTELARHLAADEEDVVEALACDGCYTPASLDRPLTSVDPGSGATLADTLAEDATDLSAAEARIVLGPLVSQLAERDRRILHLRFFEQRTQQEIADEIGVTQMHVSRLLSKILARLREEIDSDGERAGLARGA